MTTAEACKDLDMEVRFYRTNQPVYIGALEAYAKQDRHVAAAVALLQGIERDGTEHLITNGIIIPEKLALLASVPGHVPRGADIVLQQFMRDYRKNVVPKLDVLQPVPIAPLVQEVQIFINAHGQALKDLHDFIKSADPRASKCKLSLTLPVEDLCKFVDFVVNADAAAGPVDYSKVIVDEARVAEMAGRMHVIDTTFGDIVFASGYHHLPPDFVKGFDDAVLRFGQSRSYPQTYTTHPKHL